MVDSTISFLSLTSSSSIATPMAVTELNGKTSIDKDESVEP
jgi:hypothetical protein